MNNVEMNFWSQARWSEFWGYVIILIKQVAPLLLIAFALWGVGMLMKTVVDSFRKADDDDDEDEERYKRDEYDF